MHPFHLQGRIAPIAGFSTINFFLWAFWRLIRRISAQTPPGATSAIGQVIVSSRQRKDIAPVCRKQVASGFRYPDDRLVSSTNQASRSAGVRSPSVQPRLDGRAEQSILFQPLSAGASLELLLMAFLVLLPLISLIAVGGSQLMVGTFSTPYAEHIRTDMSYSVLTGLFIWLAVKLLLGVISSRKIDYAWKNPVTVSSPPLAGVAGRSLRSAPAGAMLAATPDKPGFFLLFFGVLLPLVATLF